MSLSNQFGQAGIEQANVPPRRHRRVIRLLVKLLLFGVLAWLVGRAMVNNLSGVHWDQVHLRWGFLATAWGIRLVQMAIAVTAMRLLLEHMCPAPSWPVMFGVITVSSIGKYVPGRLAGLLGGAWMFRQRNVPVPAFTGMVFMSRGLSLGLDLLAAVPLLLWQPISQRLPLAWAWSLGLVGVVAVCLHPRIFLGLGNWALHRLGQARLGGTWRFGQYVRPLALMALNAVLGGAAIWLTALSIGDLSPRWIPVLISTGALTAVAGVLAFFAPGGLGISEGILLVVLGQVLPPVSTAIVIIASRLMWTSTDILLALGGLAILKLNPPKSGEANAHPAHQ